MAQLALVAVSSDVEAQLALVASSSDVAGVVGVGFERDVDSGAVIAMACGSDVDSDGCTCIFGFSGLHGLGSCPYSSAILNLASRKRVTGGYCGPAPPM